jgi:hypothetical protein
MSRPFKFLHSGYSESEYKAVASHSFRPTRHSPNRSPSGSTARQ